MTPWIAARQDSLSITNSWSSLKLRSIESVMPSSHLIHRRPLLLLPPIPPRIRVFSNESTLHMRWPKYWSFSLSISPSVPPLKYHLILPQDSYYSMSLCKQWNRKCPGFRVLAGKKVQSERSAHQAPKRLISPLSKRGGNNDDNLFYCAGERRKKMKCSFSKIRQAWLIDFDSKITILIYPTNAN